MFICKTFGKFYFNNSISSVHKPWTLCRWYKTFLLFLIHLIFKVHSNIIHLQNALQQISSWMTANLLTLNSSKSEFLITGLKQQLAELHNCSLSIIKSACSVDFLFDKQITDQKLALSKSCCSHFHDLIRKRPPLFTPNFTIGTVMHYTIVR